MYLHVHFLPNLFCRHLPVVYTFHSSQHLLFFCSFKGLFTWYQGYFHPAISFPSSGSIFIHMISPEIIQYWNMSYWCKFTPFSVLNQEFHSGTISDNSIMWAKNNYILVWKYRPINASTGMRSAWAGFDIGHFQKYHNTFCLSLQNFA